MKKNNVENFIENGLRGVLVTVISVLAVLGTYNAFADYVTTFRELWNMMRNSLSVLSVSVLTAFLLTSSLIIAGFIWSFIKKKVTGKENGNGYLKQSLEFLFIAAVAFFNYIRTIKRKSRRRKCHERIYNN